MDDPKIERRQNLNVPTLLCSLSVSNFDPRLSEPSIGQL